MGSGRSGVIATGAFAVSIFFCFSILPVFFGILIGVQPSLQTFGVKCEHFRFALVYPEIPRSAFGKLSRKDWIYFMAGALTAARHEFGRKRLLGIEREQAALPQIQIRFRCHRDQGSAQNVPLEPQGFIWGTPAQATQGRQIERSIADNFAIYLHPTDLVDGGDIGKADLGWLPF